MNSELCAAAYRESELQSATFGANEASCHLSDLRAQVDQLAAATHIAEEAAAAAASALEAAQQEAEKEKAARQRHEDVSIRTSARSCTAAAAALALFGVLLEFYGADAQRCTVRSSGFTQSAYTPIHTCTHAQYNTLWFIRAWLCAACGCRLLPG